MSTHDATFFVQLEPEFRGTHLMGIKAARLTQNRPHPSNQKPGTVMVKLTVRVPDAAFMPFQPEAIIVVPEDMTAAAPIEVEVEDPGQGGES